MRRWSRSMAKHFIEPKLKSPPTVERYRGYDEWLAVFERSCQFIIERCQDPEIAVGQEMLIIRMAAVAGEQRAGLRDRHVDFERLFRAEFKLTGLAFKLSAAM